MEDEQPPTTRPEITDPGYSPNQPLRNFIDNIGIQVELYPKFRDDYGERIADSFAELDWTPGKEGIKKLRQELEGPWKKAILVEWGLDHEKIKVLREALNRSKSKLVNGTMIGLTDELLEDMAPEEEYDPHRHKRDRMEDARISSIRDDGQEQVNWLRLRNCMDMTPIRVPGQGDLRIQVKNTQLSSLLRLSLHAAKKHSGLFITADDSPKTMGTDTHLEAFATAKSKAGELLTQVEEALEGDMVELICDYPERLEGIHETLIHAFVTAVLAFATIEARWATFHHPSAMGKIHGHGVLEMIEELRQDERLPNTQLRAAGALIATLQPSEKWGPLQDLRELAYLVASEAPALGSPMGAETLQKQLRCSAYTAIADKEDEDLDETAPRPANRHLTYYAKPPSYARVNGNLDAPLAGPLDKRQPLKELTEEIRKNWATRPVKEAIVTINALTLYVETLRTLSELRKRQKRKKKASADKYIPQIHQRFLQQSTLANADDYIVTAADEVAYIRENAWKHYIREKVEEIEMGDHGIDLDVFVRWLDGYEPSGTTQWVTCGCGIEFKAGRNPTSGTIGHLEAIHDERGSGNGGAGGNNTPRPDHDATRPLGASSVRIYNPRSQPAKKKAKPGPEAQAQKRRRSHSGQDTGYNRRPDHDDRNRRRDRDDHARSSREDRKDLSGHSGRRDRRDWDDRNDSAGPRPRK